MSENKVLNDIINDFNSLSSKPQSFLSVQDKTINNVKQLLKKNYDFTKNQDVKISNSNALPELIVENFDLEQIWQQIELQNDGLITSSLVNVSKFIVAKNRLAFNELTNQAENDVDDDENVNMEEENDSDDDESNDDNFNISDESNDDLSLNSDENEEKMEGFSDEDEENNVQSNKKGKSSIVDDEFFKLDEMEAFLRSEEKKINDAEPDSGNDSDENEEDEYDDDGEIDFFKPDLEDIESNDKERGSAKNPNYKDFFDVHEEPKKVNSKKSKFLEEQAELEEAEEEERQKSAFELRQAQLRKKIGHLEDNAISEKPWQLKGEIKGEGRPINSLLEEMVDFDLTTRPAPVITEQTSLRLEDIIKQRIKDAVFDSVVRKEKPIETALEYKKKLVLDQEKSKVSLSQIYENEYLKQKEASNPDADEKEEEEPELHKEVKKMLRNVFHKLDSLSNFHYTPKQVMPELKIISNLPAVNMEEVAPVGTSDAALLAPEEVKGKLRGEIVGKSERTDTDKKRERRKKKQLQRKHVIQKEKKDKLINKLNPGLGNKYSKEKAKKELERAVKDRNVDKLDENQHKATKSSTAFFQQLENEVKTLVHSKGAKKGGKKKDDTLTAKKFKL